MTGKAANGKAFKGKFTINSFKSVGGKTYAVGMMTGTVKNRKVTARTSRSRPSSPATPRPRPAPPRRCPAPAPRSSPSSPEAAAS